MVRFLYWDGSDAEQALRCVVTIDELTRSFNQYSRDDIIRWIKQGKVKGRLLGKRLYLVDLTSFIAFAKPQQKLDM